MQKKETLLFVLFSIVVLLFPIVQANAFECPQHKGIWADGQVEAITAVGSMAYAAAGPVLMALRINDPNQPEVIGRLPLPAKVWDIAVDGDLAVAAMGRRGIAIIDLTHPSSPLLIHIVPVSGFAKTVALFGDRLVVSVTSGYYMETWHLEFFDLIDPSDPIQLSDLTHDFSTIYARQSSIAIDNSFAYWMVEGEVAVIDIRNPAGPNVLHTTMIDDCTSNYCSALGLIATNDLLYIAHRKTPATGGGWNSVLTIVSTTSNGRLLHNGRWVQENVYWADLSITGTIAAVTSYRHVDFFSIAHSSVPSFISRLTSDGAPYKLALGTGFAIGTSSDLRVIDTSNLLEPRWAATVTTGGSLQALTTFDDNIFAFSYKRWPSPVGSIEVLQLGDRAEPVSVTAVEISDTGFVNAVVHNDVLVVTTTEERLLTFDLADPYAPELQGSLFVGDDCNLAIRDDTAFVGCQYSDNRIKIVDLLDAANPRVVGELIVPWHRRELGVAGQLLVVATWSGMMIYDLSTPFSPELLATIDDLEFVETMAMTGDTVYLGTNSGLHVFDLSDPIRPTQTEYFATPERIENLATTDGLLWISLAGHSMVTYSYGDPGDLYVYDISDPLIPKYQNGPLDPRGVFEVVSINNIAVAASSNEGIVTFDTSCGSRIDTITPRATD